MSSVNVSRCCVALVSLLLLCVGRVQAKDQPAGRAADKEHQQRQAAPQKAKPTEQQFLAIKADAIAKHLPTLGGFGAAGEKQKPETVLSTTYKYRAVPDVELAKKGLVKVTGDLPMQIDLNKGQAMWLGTAPGTQLTVLAGTVVGQQKVVRGELVSTMGVDDEGFLKHTFDGTAVGTQVLDVERDTLYEYQPDGRFTPVPAAGGP